MSFLAGIHHTAEMILSLKVRMREQALRNPDLGVQFLLYLHFATPLTGWMDGGAKSLTKLG